MGAKQTRILMVDDEPDIGYFLKQYLSLRRFDVSIAKSAEEALQMLEKEPADIILLDLLMNGMSGMAAAKIIREKYPQSKIIIVTAHPLDAENVCRDVPVEGIYIKPLGIQDLYTKLSNL